MSDWATQQATELLNLACARMELVAPVADALRRAQLPRNIVAASARKTDTCPLCSAPETSPTIQRAITWLAERAQVLIEKNRLYGDSAANPIRVFSRAAAEVGVRVRIDDKLSRIARSGKEIDPTEDTVGDLVGYLAILAGLREQ